MADVYSETIICTAPASTGNQDFLGVAIGSNVPKAVIVIGGASDTAETVDARMSVGFYDGTTQRCMACVARDNLTSTDANRKRSDSKVLMQAVSGTGFLDVAGVALIAGGVRLNFLGTTSGRKFSVVLIWGNDVTNAALGTVDIGTGNTAIATTGLGFAPNAIITTNIGPGAVDTLLGFGLLNLGIACNDGLGGGVKQRAMFWVSEDGRPAGGNQRAYISNNRLSGEVFVSGSVPWDLTLNSFDADGFTVTPSASSLSTPLYYIALRVTNAEMNIISMQTPVVTGNADYTGTGFTPALGIGVLSKAQTENTVVTAAEATGYSTWSIGTGLTQACQSMRDRAVDPSDSSEFLNVSNALQTLANTGGADQVGQATSWLNNGVRINHTTVVATGTFGWGWFVQGHGDDPVTPYSPGERSTPFVDKRDRLNEFRAYPKL